MRSTQKKTLAERRREAVPSKIIHLRIPDVIHNKLEALGMRLGKSTSTIYREMLVAGLRASA